MPNASGGGVLGGFFAVAFISAPFEGSQRGCIVIRAAVLICSPARTRKTRRPRQTGPATSPAPPPPGRASPADRARPDRLRHQLQPRVRPERLAHLGARLPLRHHHVGREVVAPLVERGADSVGVRRDALLLELTDLL